MKKIRNNNFKWVVFCGIVLMLIVFSLSGCAKSSDAVSTGSDNQGKLVKQDFSNQEYVMITWVSAVEYWKDVRLGFEKAAADLGVKATYTGIEGVDPGEQVTLFEGIVARKPAGVILAPADRQSLTKSIDKAMDAGIPVVTFDGDSIGSKRLTLFATDNVSAGAKGSELVGGILNGEGNVGIIYIAGAPSQEERKQGFEDGLKEKFPNIKIVGTVDDKGDAVVGTKEATTLVQANPDLDLIIGFDASAGASAVRGIDESGRSGQIKVVAFDKNLDTLQYIKEGKIEATLVQRSFVQGYMTITMLFWFNNDTMPHFKGWKENNLYPCPDVVDTGIMVVNKSNVGTLMK